MIRAALPPPPPLSRQVSNRLAGLCDELFRLPALAMLKLDHNRIPSIPPAVEKLGCAADPAHSSREGRDCRRPSQ
jgi:Leucine-rich repeat (LRR) protein